MTLKQMIEIIRQPFPEYPRTQVLFDLNVAQREFCYQTQILAKSLLMERSADYIGLLNTDEKYEKWQLPADTFEVVKIDELLRDNYELRDTVLVLDPAGFYIPRFTVRYSRVPAVMVADGDEPSIPQEFQYALVEKVLAKYYMKMKEASLYSACMGEWQRYIQEAKRWVNSMRYRNQGDFTGTGPINSSSAYQVAYGRLHLDEGKNTVTMTKTFTTKGYTLMLNGNGIEANEYDPNSDYGYRTTSTFDVVSANDNDNFEYFAIGS